MKNGVSLARLVRNGIIFLLAFIISIGVITNIYDTLTRKDLQDSNSETDESLGTTDSSLLSEPSSEIIIMTEDDESEVAIATEPHAQENESTLEVQNTPETTEVSNESEVVSNKESTPESENNDLPEENCEPVGIICLTFDDGPSSNTAQILDILAEKNVKATFFILNYTDDGLNLVKREIADGHTVGLHGYSHDYAIYSSLESTINNFTLLQEKLYNDTGYLSNIIRFPGGASNTVSKKYCIGIMTEATQAVTDMGFTYFDWNVDSDDAGSAKSSEEIYNNVISTLVEGRTNVVLMHDAGAKIYTPEAVSLIIDYGIEHGFEFQAITESTTVVQHGVNN